MDKFIIVDLISQRDAVRHHLDPLSKEEIIHWLMEHGYVIKKKI